ncbi:MAG: sigma-70 family RNA polymerase sigma factor [Thermoanaerobaculia bacterium]|nr:sigma-70 family RNA polymerase sigma factor [Thermoanaerobaculia bacterium]
MVLGEGLAERFEDQRARLEGLAGRILGSATEAEDAVQEAWLRLARTGDANIQNLGSWLTAVTARICLDLLRSRRSRAEESLEMESDPGFAVDLELTTPEEEALLGESLGLALGVLLESLTPAERVAFVLHDLFAVPFEEIAAIVERSPAAARQLASRARRQLRLAAMAPRADRARQTELVAAFLAASRRGDLDALLAVLDPEAVIRADATVVRMGGEALVLGARAVAETFRGRARAAQLALLDGQVGAAWLAGGVPRVIFRFTVVAGRILAIDLIADSEVLASLPVEVLDEPAM